MAKITAHTAVVLRSTGSSGTLAWRTEPPEAAEYCQPVQILGAPALLFSWPNHPQVAVLLIATDGAVIVTDRFVIPADGDRPPPPPPPPPPLKVAEVVVVYETSLKDPKDKAELDRKIHEGQVILDLAWQKHLAARGVNVLCLDDDQLPARLQPLKARAAGKSVVFFVGDSGVDKAVMVPLPQDKAEMLRLVKEKVK